MSLVDSPHVAVEVDWFPNLCMSRRSSLGSTVENVLETMRKENKMKAEMVGDIGEQKFSSIDMLEISEGVLSEDGYLRVKFSNDQYLVRRPAVEAKVVMYKKDDWPCKLTGRKVKVRMVLDVT